MDGPVGLPSRPASRMLLTRSRDKRWRSAQARVKPSDEAAQNRPRYP
jgi:hypothetical protein